MRLRFLKQHYINSCMLVLISIDYVTMSINYVAKKIISVLKLCFLCTIYTSENGDWSHFLPQNPTLCMKMSRKRKLTGMCMSRSAKNKFVSRTVVSGHLLNQLKDTTKCTCTSCTLCEYCDM